MGAKYNILTPSQNFDLCVRLKSHIEGGAERFATHAAAASHFSTAMGITLTPGNIRGAIKAIGRTTSDAISSPVAVGNRKACEDLESRVARLEECIAKMLARAGGQEAKRS